MSLEEDPEDDYEKVDHGDPNATPLTISTATSCSEGGGTLSRTNNFGPPVRPRYTNSPENGAPPPLPPASSKRSVAGLSGKQSLPPVTPRGRVNYENRSRASKMESSLAYSGSTPSHTPQHRQTSSVTSEDGESLMLADLVRKYSRSLPLKVRVDEGFCGQEERFVISSGDIYNFHFLKNERVVSIQDCGNASFSIPLNSTIKFGILYNPSNNFKLAVKGVTFSSVSEVLQAKTLPRALRVKTSSQAPLSDGKVLDKDEILLVRKTGKSMLRKPFLKVFSATKREEKTLYEDCSATFETAPDQVPVHLTDIMEVFSESLPLDVMMYPPDDEDMDDLPPHLRSDKVTITHTSIESAVIATTCWDDDVEVDQESDDTLPISIPIEMEIEVTILNTDEEDLYMTTKSFIRNFDLSRITDMKDASDDGDRDRRPSKIGRRVRQGYEYRGMDFTMSEKVYDDHDATPLPCPFRSVLNQPLPPVPGGGASLNDSLPHQSSLLVKSPIPSPSQAHQQAPPTLPARGSKNYPDVKLKPKSEKKAPQPPVSPRPKSPPKSPHLSKKQPPVMPRDSPKLPHQGAQKYPFVTPRDSTKSPQPGAQRAEIPNWKVISTNVKKAVPTSPSLDSSDSIYQNQKMVSPPGIPTVKPKSPPLPPMPVPVATGSTSPGAGEKELTELRLTVKSMKALMDARHEDSTGQIRGLREEVARLNVAIDGLRQDCLTLKQEVAQAKGASASPVGIPRGNTMSFSPSLPGRAFTAPPTGITAVSPEQERDNLATLKSLSNTEVLMLLDAMKLSMYRDAFAEETIDGEVLGECDEQILETELGVTNKLHRMRLMKLVSGRHSSHYYFTEGLNPYGQLAAPPS